MTKENLSIPNYSTLVEATFLALKKLGGSGTNKEINNKVAELLDLSEEVLAVPHLNSSSLSEINYRCAWARTLLKNAGAIENSARCVWSIKPEYARKENVDGDYIEKNCRKSSQNKNTKDIETPEQQMEKSGVEIPEEVLQIPLRRHTYSANSGMTFPE